MTQRCPKCGQADMAPDHDRVRNIESYACPVCGMRVYPGYPRRIRAGMRSVLVGDGVGSGFKPDPTRYRGNPCGICGEWVPVSNRGKPRGYCDGCRIEARRRGLVRHWRRILQGGP